MQNRIRGSIHPKLQSILSKNFAEMNEEEDEKEEDERVILLKSVKVENLSVQAHTELDPETDKES